MKKILTILALALAVISCQAMMFFGGSTSDADHADNIDNATGSGVNLYGDFYGSFFYQNGNQLIGTSPVFMSVGANALYYPDGSPFAYDTNSLVQLSWPSGFGSMFNTNGALVLPFFGTGQGGLANAFGNLILDRFGNFVNPLNATTLQGLSATNFLLTTNNLTLASGTNGTGSAAGGVGGIVNIANGGKSDDGTPGAGGTVNIANSGQAGGFDYNGGTVNIATSLYGTGGTVNLATSGGIAGTVNAGNINAGNVAGTFIGDGSQLTGLSAAQIAGLPETNVLVRGMGQINGTWGTISGLSSQSYLTTTNSGFQYGSLAISPLEIGAHTNINLIFKFFATNTAPVQWTNWVHVFADSINGQSSGLISVANIWTLNNKWNSFTNAIFLPPSITNANVLVGLGQNASLNCFWFPAVRVEIK